MFGAFLFSALMGTFGAGGFDAGSRSVVCELRFSPGVLVWYHVLTESGEHPDSQNAGAAGDGHKIERWHRPLQFIGPSRASRAAGACRHMQVVGPGSDMSNLTRAEVLPE